MPTMSRANASYPGWCDLAPRVSVRAMSSRAPTTLLLTLTLAACGDSGGATTDTSGGSTGATTSAASTTGGSTGATTTVTTDTPTSSSGATDGGSTGGGTTGGATTSATTGPGVDCDALPALPDAPELVWSGYDGSEDLAFDGAGRVALKRGGQVVLVGPDQSESVLAEGFPQIYGTRYLIDGALLVALPQSGVLQTISPGGDIVDVASGLSSPNGVYVDPDGRVWVTEFGASRVVRFAADWTSTTIYAGPMAGSANGVVFDPTRGLLFFTNYGAGRLLRLAIDAQGQPVGEPAQVTSIDGAKLDGLALDVCGNIYAVDQGGSALYRVRLDGAGELVSTDPPVKFPTNVANPQFGRGPGFAEDSLYLAGNPGDLYRVVVGIPGAPIGLP